MPKKTPVRHAYDPDFEAAYRAYPRRADKIAAERSWFVAVRKIDGDELLRLIILYAEYVSDREQRWIPHMRTWLHEERWMGLERSMQRDRSTFVP